MEEADALCDRVALMHRGRLRAVGTRPSKLKAQISNVSPRATLEDVFRYYAASGLEDDPAESNRESAKSALPERLRAVSVDTAFSDSPGTLVRAPHGWQRVGATTGRIAAFAIVEL